MPFAGQKGDERLFLQYLKFSVSLSSFVSESTRMACYNIRCAMESVGTGLVQGWPVCAFG